VASADGVRLAFESARAAYSSAGVEDRLTLFIEPGIGHDVTETMWTKVEEFLDLYLKEDT
jgi:hypothetical protein